jgi:CheY-like chemotaxis protein
MNLNSTKRILLVENTEELRDDYVARIRKEVSGLEIDEATSEEDALRCIADRTYHVAILDIMLTTEENDRGGLNVLDAIRSSNEGTLAIMLSSTSEIDCAIHAIRSRIVVDYVHKSELRTSFASLIKPLRTGLKEAHIPVFGKYGRLTAYLAAPSDPAIWEYSAMSALGSGGFDPLNNALSDVFRKITPALCLKKASAEGQPSLTIDKSKKALHGIFWSKAMGHAVAVCLWAQPGEPVVADGATEMHEISNHGAKHLKGGDLARPDRSG